MKWFSRASEGNQKEEKLATFTLFVFHLFMTSFNIFSTFIRFVVILFSCLSLFVLYGKYDDEPGKWYARAIETTTKKTAHNGQSKDN